MTAANPIAAMLTVGHVDLAFPASTKDALLDSLARKAATMTGLRGDDVRAALSAREALGSTGVGAGIALPHARIEGLPRLFGLFARLERPVPFEAIDRAPVDLVLLLLSPVKGHAEHLAMLAALSRRLRDRDVARALRAARTAEEACALLTASTG